MTSASEAVGIVERLIELRRFLNGDADYKGWWFGDARNGKQFFWRELLPVMDEAAALIEQQAATIAERDAWIELLREAVKLAHDILVTHRIARALREDARMGGAADAVSKAVNKLRTALAKVQS